MNQDKLNHRNIVMIAVFIATFMASVEGTIVTTALPAIISSLNGLSHQSWIMSAYLLTTAITTPIYGKLADVWGRRLVFQWGVVVFTLGSLFSGLSTNITLLILARAIQGVGAGAMMPITFTIIADYYDFEERARVIALNNSAWGLSSLVGPMIGGFLVDSLSWHWVFFVNIPLGIIVLIIIHFGYQKSTSKPDKVKIDLGGIASLSIMLICLLIGVQMLATKWTISVILLLFSIIALIVFVRIEHKVDEPIIATKLFANRSFSIQIITSTLISGVLVGYEVYFPIWLQSLYRLTAAGAGFIVTSSSIMWLIASFFVGNLLSHFVPKKISLVAITVLILSFVPLCFASAQFPVWMFYVIAMINGTCIGLIISINLVLAQNFAPSDMLGSASSIVTLGRSLGQTIMNGIYGAVLNIMINLTRGSIPFTKINDVISSSSSKKPDSIMAQVVLNGLHGIFLVATIMLIVCWIVNLSDPLNRIVQQKHSES